MTAPEPEAARVFLSWSGERSRHVAKALKRHIESLSERLDPWLSEDLEPGAEWANTLVAQIRDARLAVLCLTKRNTAAPWISFETGAFYTSPLREGVVPFLLDPELQPSDLKFPLGLFQSLSADWNGTKALFLRVGKLVGLDAETIQRHFLTVVWPQLEDEIETIRTIADDGTRTDEPGNWMNVANAFFLGHDLRWTIDVIMSGGAPDDIKHGLRQTLHQADELGLSRHNHFLILAAQATEIVNLPAEQWTPEVRRELCDCLRDALERFGALVVSRQPGYQPCAPDNQQSWLAIQAARRA